jgi:hypothetical protein
MLARFEPYLLLNNFVIWSLRQFKQFGQFSYTQSKDNPLYNPMSLEHIFE